jgi:hypothetical protein
MAEPLTNVIVASILHLGSTLLGSSMLDSCTSAALTSPQEQTKGDDTAPIVPANGAITTKSTRAVDALAVAATVRCALHPKVTGQPWAAGRATGGHHSIHGGRNKKNLYNRRGRKGVTGGGTPNKGYD